MPSGFMKGNWGCATALTIQRKPAIWISPSLNVCRWRWKIRSRTSWPIRFRPGIRPGPGLAPGTVWRWSPTRSDTLVEFLTPSFRPEEDIRPLPALGVSAQSLHFLNYLIARPTPAALLYRSGILIQIPRPEAFAIHKLIVANRRRGGPDALKSEKDRRQAAFLIEALAEDRPDELAEGL